MADEHRLFARNEHDVMLVRRENEREFIVEFLRSAPGIAGATNQFHILAATYAFQSHTLIPMSHVAAPLLKSLIPSLPRHTIILQKAWEMFQGRIVGCFARRSRYCGCRNIWTTAT
jgi:hypothetical protein